MAQFVRITVSGEPILVNLDQLNSAMVDGEKLKLHFSGGRELEVVSPQASQILDQIETAAASSR